MKFNNKEKHIWEVSKKTQLPVPPDKDAVWMRLVQEIEIYENKNNDYKANVKKSRWSTWLGIGPKTKAILALSFMIVLLSPLTYDLYYTKKLYTNAAQKETLLLPDGTKVMLNSESMITYNRNYNKDNRSVNLTGEAYFIVNKGDIPFNIHTSHGEVSVLGTSFNVRSRDEGFEVGVNEGKVQVINGHSRIYLTKNQLIDVRFDFMENDISQITMDKYPDWINQKFYCNQTTLGELCLEVERTFDIQIKFLDPNIKKLTVSGLIEASNLNNVLHTISLLTKQEFKLEGDICTIL